MGTLVENVAQVKADFKSVREAINYAIPKGTPTSEYGERIHNEISNLMSQADSNYNYGFEAGREEGLEQGLEQGRTEGIEQGKQEVISNSKYIEKSASGKVIRLDDVSEVYHKVKVKADTPTEVKVYGKNLFDGLLEIGGVDSTTGNNTTITTSVRTANYIPIFPNTTYTITREFTTGNIRTRFYDADKNYVGYGFSASTSPMTFTTKDNYYYLRLDLAGDTNNLTEKVQVEFGSATEYEPYKGQTITATAEGTEIPSICPTMTFLADSEVTVDYYGSYGMAEKELAMWNRLTFNGKRKSYTYAYSYVDLTGMIIPEGLCKPSTSIMYMFYEYEGSTLPKGIDMSGFDVNAVTASYQAFGLCNTSTKLLKVYDMGLGACKTYENAYRNCYKLHTIEIIRCAEHSVFTNTFQNDTELTHCIFEGTLASNINLQWSPKLDLESLVSLIDCLKHFNYVDPDNAFTKTITLSSESWALLDTWCAEAWPEWGSAQEMIQGYLGWNVA